MLAQPRPPPPPSSSTTSSDTTPTSHQPTNAYTTGLPAPPRILIPPPQLNPLHDNIASPEWSQPSLSAMVLQQSSTILPGSLQDWKYEYRREAQQLLPHLFLGPLSSTKNTSFLQQNNITLLLAVRSSMTARARLLGGGGGSGGGGGGQQQQKQHTLPGVRYESIDVANNSELISQFQRAQEIIDSHYVSGLHPDEASVIIGSGKIPLDGRELRVFQETWMTARGNRNVVPGGKTLLFCESGNERSAVVAAAYIMQHLGGSTVQAIQMVQGRRFCVCFDDAMKWMLTSYEPIWKARCQSRQGGGGGGGVGGGRKGKRRMEEDDDDDGEDMWNSGGGGRAPFLDEGDTGDDIEMG